MNEREQLKAWMDFSSRCGQLLDGWHCRFAVLADEAGQHACPRCGLAPEDEYPDESAGYATDEMLQEYFDEMEPHENDPRAIGGGK